MSKWMNSRVGSVAVCLLTAVMPACVQHAAEPGEKGEVTGAVQAAISVGGNRHDVTAVYYKVVPASSTCSDAAIAETTSPLEDEAIPGSVLPSGSGPHAGADGLFVLPPGDYRVCAVPLSANAASQECAPTEGTVTVLPEVTTEILLTSQCGAPANGAGDVVVTLNDPPKIDNLTIAPSKFIIACQTATITATVSDPDGDQVSYDWSVTSSPAGSAPRLQGTNGSATFATDLPGDYQVRLSVTDVHGAKSSLSFPFHVSALNCTAQDQCHVAGSCDLNTGACSNPTAPDATSCDDGDPNTSSDVCTSGVCSGSASTCACPAGFTSLPGNHCSKTYDIDASLLINQSESCDIAGANRFNDCNGQPYGFQWDDIGGALASVTQVDVALESGVTCAGGTRTVTLNGTSTIGNFNTVGYCSCDSSHGTVTLSSASPSNYHRGGTNTVGIFLSSSCEGLSQSGALNGSYARVTVTYGLGSTCGSSCGDGVCDSTESCQSCPSDCGACSQCGSSDLGFTVPQTVTGSTVGRADSQNVTCAASGGPDQTFTFTASTTRTYEINLFGSTYDTVLHVHDGTCTGAVLACNDDAGSLTSQVFVSLTAGQTITIVVDGYGNSSGNFTLNIL